jgi:myosin-5
LIYKQCDKNDRFPGKPLHKGKGQFIINHYAGAVLYDSEGFVEKNKDETPRGASTLLESSSKGFVQLLGKITRGDDEGEAPATGARTKKRPTVGSQFSSQLVDLRKRIDQTAPHYVRCLKPNQSLKASEFESAMIADQLRYAGVLEAIRVSRVGYSQRYSHSAFIERYRFIALDAVQKVDDNHKVTVLVDEIAKQIWEALNPGAGP